MSDNKKLEEKIAANRREARLRGSNNFRKAVKNLSNFIIDPEGKFLRYFEETYAPSIHDGAPGNNPSAFSQGQFDITKPAPSNELTKFGIRNFYGGEGLQDPTWKQAMQTQVPYRTPSTPQRVERRPIRANSDSMAWTKGRGTANPVQLKKHGFQHGDIIGEDYRPVMTRGNIGKSTELMPSVNESFTDALRRTINSYTDKGNGLRSSQAPKSLDGFRRSLQKNMKMVSDGEIIKGLDGKATFTNEDLLVVLRANMDNPNFFQNITESADGSINRTKAVSAKNVANLIDDLRNVMSKNPDRYPIESFGMAQDMVNKFNMNFDPSGQKYFKYHQIKPNYANTEKIPQTEASELINKEQIINSGAQNPKANEINTKAYQQIVSQAENPKAVASEIYERLPVQSSEIDELARSVGVEPEQVRANTNPLPEGGSEIARSNAAMRNRMRGAIDHPIDEKLFQAGERFNRAERVAASMGDKVQGRISNMKEADEMYNRLSSRLSQLDAERNPDYLDRLNKVDSQYQDLESQRASIDLSTDLQKYDDLDKRLNKAVQNNDQRLADELRQQMFEITERLQPKQAEASRISKQLGDLESQRTKLSQQFEHWYDGRIEDDVVSNIDERQRIIDRMERLKAGDFSNATDTPASRTKQALSGILDQYQPGESFSDTMSRIRQAVPGINNTEDLVTTINKLYPNGGVNVDFINSLRQKIAKDGFRYDPRVYETMNNIKSKYPSNTFEQLELNPQYQQFPKGTRPKIAHLEHLRKGGALLGGAGLAYGLKQFSEGDYNQAIQTASAIGAPIAADITADAATTSTLGRIFGGAARTLGSAGMGVGGAAADYVIHGNTPFSNEVRSSQRNERLFDIAAPAAGMLVGGLPGAIVGSVPSMIRPAINNMNKSASLIQSQRTAQKQSPNYSPAGGDMDAQYRQMMAEKVAQFNNR